MSDSQSNKKIAINTVYMYVRLFMTLVIGLYTSRVVLLVLGISDFGLFNVVGALLTMFTFISGSLSAATSRFFNVELGKPNGDVNKSYNVNLVLHSILAVITLILSETIGLWYVYNKLNVPPGQLENAVFIFHISIFSACLGVLSGPCSSLFIAYERFGFLAKLDILNSVLRLCGVIFLQYYRGDVLRLYSVIMCLTTVNTFVIYYFLAAREWPTVIKFRFIKGWSNYRDVITFGGWNLLSTVALMVRSTGCDLVINHFFTTAVNGAFAISKTVNNYVTTFSTNFDSASAPQIIQSYSVGNLSRCNYLTNKLGRFCLLLFAVIFFPLYIELDFLLHLWLKEVPADVLIFSQLNLLLAGVALTCGGIVQVINASGKIKWFKINGSIFFIICVPIGYLLYKIGAPAYSMLILFIVADIFQRIIQLVLLKKIIGFDSWAYVKDAYARPAIIAAIMATILWGYSFTEVSLPFGKLLIITSCFILTSGMVYAIGLTPNERRKVNSIVINRISRRRRIA